MRNPTFLIKKIKKSNISELSRRAGLSRRAIYNFIGGGNITFKSYEKISKALKEMGII